MKMPEVGRAVPARRFEIAERPRNVVGREWVLDTESERRPYESDGLMACSALPLLVVLPDSTGQVRQILLYCRAVGIKLVPRGSVTSLSGGALPLEDGILLTTARVSQLSSDDVIADATVPIVVYARRAFP
jgi:glycolate oxidase